MNAEDARRVFRRASRGYVAYRRMSLWQAAVDRDEEGTPELEQMLVEAQSRFNSVYDTTTVEAAEALFRADHDFCKSLLETIALDLGQQAASQMRRALESVQTRYLERPGHSSSLRDLARVLSAWLVYKAGSPFPMIREDEPFWQSSDLGPPPELGTVPPRESRPGGASDRPSADAGVTVIKDPEPGLPMGLDLPRRWWPWGTPLPAHARYPLHLFSVANEDELKGRLLDPSKGGHPILLMVEQRLEKSSPVLPYEIYLSLRKAPAERDGDLLRLIDDIEQYLFEGLESYEELLQERDWEELRPLLNSAKELLFPNLEQKSYEHRFGDYLIGQIIGWTPRQILQAVSLGVSIAIGILLAVPTIGGSLGLSAASLTTAMIAFDVATLGVSIGIAIQQHQERTEANRFAAINEGLRVASSTNNLHWDVLLDVMMLLAPIALGAAVGEVRRAWLRRALAAMPEETVSKVATPATKKQALNAIKSKRATGPSQRGTSETGSQSVPDRGTGTAEAPSKPIETAPPVTTASDVFLNLTTRQKRAISKVQTALSGSTKGRIDEALAHDYIRFFMSKGATFDEAISQTVRWADVQKALGKMGIGNLPNPRNVSAMKEYFEQAERSGFRVNEALLDAEQRISRRLGAPIEAPPGSSRARASDALGPQRPRLPTPKNRDVEGLVEYRSTDLSEAVFQRRAAIGDWGGGNYAAVEFTDPEGIVRIFVMRSRRGVAHSEALLLDALENVGIKPSSISRLYTERSPCVTRASCSTLLANKLADRAKVTWTFDFETTVEVDELIQGALRKMANKELRQAVRPGSPFNPREETFPQNLAGGSGSE